MALFARRFFDTMTRSLRYLWLGFALLFGILPLITSATFVVTNPDDITLTLPSDGSSYTLQHNSHFDSYSVGVGADNFSFTIAPGNEVVVVSSGRKNLTNSLGAVTTCSANQSSVTLGVSGGDVTKTVTVTPSGTCGSGGGGGGSSGGGGGGGSSSSVPIVLQSSTPTQSNNSAAKPTVESLQAQLALLIQQLNDLKSAPGRQSAAASTSGVGTITHNLRRGMQGDEVKDLQQFLASDRSIYPEGTVNGYYGPKTFAAVKRFQKKYGLPPVGVVGPLTRQKIKDLVSR